MNRTALALIAFTVVIAMFVANRVRTRQNTEAKVPRAATVVPTAPASSSERPLDRDFKAAMGRETAAASGH